MKIQQSIQATFSAIAVRRYDQTALASDGQQITYGELERHADQIAAYLQRHGVRRGDRVGIYSQRSITAVAAMLGILKAGAAYVPFDPTYPPKLLKFVYQDCTPALMLVQASLAGSGAFWEGASHDLGTARDPLTSAAATPPAVGAEDAAYLMYTSGSTGHPKGVLVPHRGVVRLVIDNPFATMGPDQVHLQLAPLAFDASTFEIWGALLNGGKLAILSAPQPSLQDVAQAIAEQGVTTLWLTAGLFHLMVDHRLDGLLPLKQLLAGGDVLSPTHVLKAQQGLPDCQLINGYGPTENTTFTCCYRIPRTAMQGAIPIGTPIAHTQVYVMDEARQLVADGQEGELYAGGEGLALGYWNRPELTAERFVSDPRDPSGLVKLYRTGDRVRRRPDGNLEFLGRLDRQIKINGKRVELDEIEACLRRSPLLEDAAVTSPSGQSSNRRIHAYVKLCVAARAADDTNTSQSLRDFLKQELPDYMVPATITVMDALPLSATGKIDRSKLLPPQAAPASAPATTAGNEIEASLLSLWSQVLGNNSLGIEDNFFDLGGTSLQLIAVHATISASMTSAITIVDLFEYPRISALAAHLARLVRVGDTAATPESAVPPQGGPALSPAERARRQQATLARVRANPRRNER